MNELDWVFAVVVLISTLIGIYRGMIRELFALGGWVAAFFVSIYYASNLAEILPGSYLGPLTRMLISIVLIVIGCVFAAGLIGRLIRKILSSISLGAEDVILGCLFGLLRGVLIVVVFVYFGGMATFINTQKWWQSSEFVPYVKEGIEACSPYIPEEIRKLTE